MDFQEQLFGKGHLDSVDLEANVTEVTQRPEHKYTSWTS